MGCASSQRRLEHASKRLFSDLRPGITLTAKDILTQLNEMEKALSGLNTSRSGHYACLSELADNVDGTMTILLALLMYYNQSPTLRRQNQSSSSSSNCECDLMQAYDKIKSLPLDLEVNQPFVMEDADGNTRVWSPLALACAIPNEKLIRDLISKGARDPSGVALIAFCHAVFRLNGSDGLQKLKQRKQTQEDQEPGEHCSSAPALLAIDTMSESVVKDLIALLVSTMSVDVTDKQEVFTRSVTFQSFEQRTKLFNYHMNALQIAAGYGSVPLLRWFEELGADIEHACLNDPPLAHFAGLLVDSMLLRDLLKDEVHRYLTPIRDQAVAKNKQDQIQQEEPSQTEQQSAIELAMKRQIQQLQTRSESIIEQWNQALLMQLNGDSRLLTCWNDGPFAMANTKHMLVIAMCRRFEDLELIDQADSTEADLLWHSFILEWAVKSRMCIQRVANATMVSIPSVDAAESTANSVPAVADSITPVFTQQLTILFQLFHECLNSIKQRRMDMIEKQAAQRARAESLAEELNQLREEKALTQVELEQTKQQRAELQNQLGKSTPNSKSSSAGGKSAKVTRTSSAGMKSFVSAWVSDQVKQGMLQIEEHEREMERLDMKMRNRREKHHQELQKTGVKEVIQGVFDLISVFV